MTDATQASNEVVMGESLTSEAPIGETQSQTAVDMSQEAVNTAQEDYYANLVGDDKQYKTPQQLAKSKLDADRRIQELKDELAATQEIAQKAKTTEEILALIGSKDEREVPSEASNEQTKGVGSPEDFDAWYAAKEAQRLEDAKVAEQVGMIQANQNKAWELLSAEDAFGSKEDAKRAVAEYIGNDPKRAELVNQMGGYTPEDLASFLKSRVKREQVAFSSDNNTVSPPNNYDTLGKLTWAKVKSMEKENPKLKRDIKFQRYVTDNVEFT